MYLKTRVGKRQVSGKSSQPVVDTGARTMNKNGDMRAWAAGGTTLIGLGVGLVFLKTSALLFVACILIGLGVGLVIAPVISRNR